MLNISVFVSHHAVTSFYMSPWPRFYPLFRRRKAAKKAAVASEQVRYLLPPRSAHKHCERSVSPNLWQMLWMYFDFRGEILEFIMTVCVVHSSHCHPRWLGIQSLITIMRTYYYCIHLTIALALACIRSFIHVIITRSLMYSFICSCNNHDSLSHVFVHLFM